MSTGTNSKTSRLNRVTNVVSGLENDPPASKTILVKGKVMTPTQVIGLLNPLIGTLRAVATTKTAYYQAVAAANAAWDADAPTIIALRPALIQAYGPDSQGLAGCGVVVKVAAKRTSTENTVRAVKAAATRKANGTGKKAPKPTITVTDVDGTVIGAEATASAAAPAPVAVAAGAAVASGK